MLKGHWVRLPKPAAPLSFSHRKHQGSGLLCICEAVPCHLLKSKRQKKNRGGGKVWGWHVAQQIKVPHVMPASHMGTGLSSGCSTSRPLLTAWESSRGQPLNLCGRPGSSWLPARPDPALFIMDIWRVNQQMEDLFLSFPPYNSFKINP